MPHINLPKKLLSLLYLLLALTAQAQEEISLSPQKHEYYLNILQESKDSLFTQIMDVYNRYLFQHPDDYLVHMERCRLLEAAYYDAEEDYNPKYEEAEECKNELFQRFAEVPEVMLYKAENIYGDSALAYLESLRTDILFTEGKWAGKETWKVYNGLAENYSEDKPEKAIEFALMAMANNDTLDLSLLLAKNYEKIYKRQKAIDILLSHIDSTDSYWLLNQKGRFLLKLGKVEEAIKLFRVASKNSESISEDNEYLAEALAEKGLFDKARTYLVKETEKEWGKDKSLYKLFLFDLKNGHPDSAAASYRLFVENNFNNDPLGIYKLRLILKKPLHPWSLSDVGRILLLLLLLALPFAVPYLWILPIHYLGNYFKARGMLLVPSPFRWSLRHFWTGSALILLVNVICLLLFSYENLFPDIPREEMNPINIVTAQLDICFCLGLFLVALFHLRQADIDQLWRGNWTVKQSLARGFGFSFATGVVWKILSPVLTLPLQADGSHLLSVVDSIKSVNEFYHPLLGFTLTVLLAPLYEEFIFRGIFLSATEKYMRFALANACQSILFAAIHEDMSLFFYYFLFGFVTGYLRKNSNSLLPGITMHITNNFFAFIAVLAGRV